MIFLAKRVKKSTGLIVVIITLITTFGLFGCSQKANKYTEEEHKQRINERIEKRFMGRGSEYESFNLFSLHDENDKLKYFLVEFEPIGFIFVLIGDEQSKILNLFGASTSMYRLSNIYGVHTWSPYKIDPTNSQPYPNTEKIWELDENGNKIFYSKSPYFIADVTTEQRYLLFGNITATRRDEKFLNLVSQEKFEITDGQIENTQATLALTFISNKKFDL